MVALSATDKGFRWRIITLMDQMNPVQGGNAMGDGFDFTCKKCGKRNSAFLGIGMGMLREYESTVNEILDGTWGEEYKKIVEENQLAGPDVENELYICRACGQWKAEKNMNLYVPKDPEAIWDKQYGIMTVRERGRVPYLMRYDLEQDYRCVKIKRHICKCGKRMHKVSLDEIDTIPCQYCGTVNSVENHLCWD